MVYENHRKKDGTYNVKIRIHHKGFRRLLETPHFVTRRQLNSKFELKDKSILNLIDDTLLQYRRAISEMGNRLEMFTVDELRDFLTNKEKEIDFIEFCDEHIAGLRKQGRDGTTNNHRIVRNSLVDFFKKSCIPVTEINSGGYSPERRVARVQALSARRLPIHNAALLKCSLKHRILKQKNISSSLL